MKNVFSSKNTRNNLWPRIVKKVGYTRIKIQSFLLQLKKKYIYILLRSTSNAQLSPRTFKRYVISRKSEEKKRKKKTRKEKKPTLFSLFNLTVIRFGKQS